MHGEWFGGPALDVLVAALDEGIVLYDDKLCCRVVGRRIEEMFGVSASDLIGQRRGLVLERLAKASAEPDSLLLSVGERAVASGRTVVDPVELQHPRPRTVVWTSVPLPVESGAEADGHPSAKGGRIDVIRDVTRERRAERDTAELLLRLEHESGIDRLTGLPNQRRFEQEAEREHHRAQRAWEAYAIAVFDVDGMADINVERGREVGEEVLRCLAQMIRGARREYDVTARWGGDSFIVLLPGADVAAAKTVVTRVVTSIAEAPLAVAGEVTVTLCGGGAVWIPPSGEGASETIRRAQEALNRARKRGPSSIEVDDGGNYEWREGSGNVEET